MAIACVCLAMWVLCVVYLSKLHEWSCSPWWNPLHGPLFCLFCPLSLSLLHADLSLLITSCGLVRVWDTCMCEPSLQLNFPQNFNSEIKDCRNCGLRSGNSMLIHLLFLLFEYKCGPRGVSSEDVTWPPWRPKPNLHLRPSPNSHTKGQRSPRAFIWVERGSPEPETSEMDCCSLYPTLSVWPWNNLKLNKT